MNTIHNKTQKSTTKKSIEDVDIENVDKKSKKYDQKQEALETRKGRRQINKHRN